MDWLFIHEIGWIQNQHWFNDMIDACTAQKDISCGIYSSPDQWGYTLGSKTYSYQPATELPLWWKQDDGVADFTGFTAFGGFKEPYAKQFKSSYSICGTTTTIGENWAPAWWIVSCWKWENTYLFPVLSETTYIMFQGAIKVSTFLLIVFPSFSFSFYLSIFLSIFPLLIFIRNIIS